MWLRGKLGGTMNEHRRFWLEKRRYNPKDWYAIYLRAQPEPSFLYRE